MMTNRQWKNLTLKERNVLKSLDILSLVKPKERIKATPVLEPYILKRTTTCGTCKTVSTKYYRMAALERSSLSSIKIEQTDICPEDKIKEEKDFSLNCSQCYETFNKMSKDELIKRLIRRT